MYWLTGYDTLGHTVVVTDTGCERLSRSDLGLVVA